MAIISIRDLLLDLLLPVPASDLLVEEATGPAEVAMVTAVVTADVMAALVAELDAELDDPLFLLFVPLEAVPALTARLPSRKPTLAMTA